MICYKCNGTGYLPGYSHVAQGVCFDCKGSGTRPDRAKNNIGYSRHFVQSFQGRPNPNVLHVDKYDGREYPDPFFPGEVQPTTWEVIALHGHSSAEHRVMFWDGFYYVGQPVCRSSTWYKVPPDQWAEFKKHYKKALKIEIKTL
jgi:hypothetical protein